MAEKSNKLTDALSFLDQQFGGAEVKAKKDKLKKKKTKKKREEKEKTKLAESEEIPQNVKTENDMEIEQAFDEVEGKCFVQSSLLNYN